MPGKRAPLSQRIRGTGRHARIQRWPLMVIAAPAAVAIWSGWVGLGGLCGFGPIHPLPGIVDQLTINTAITLPVGVEAYAAYALRAWLTPGTPPAAQMFARRSAIGSLIVGMCGQVIYHLLSAAHAVRAPWPVVVLVSCIPVATLGMAAALAHMLHVAPEPVTEFATAPAAEAARAAAAPGAAPGGATSPGPGRMPRTDEEILADLVPAVGDGPVPSPKEIRRLARVGNERAARLHGLLGSTGRSGDRLPLPVSAAGGGS